MERDVRVQLPDADITGTLHVPEGARGIVLFAHGSGSSRFSPRNRFVAKQLQDAGLATLLVDLLTKQEERIDDVTGELRFNIKMLANRLVHICDWIAQQDQLRAMNIGMFGASTGGGAAIEAAAMCQDRLNIGAVVSRGGRPDLASDKALQTIRCPTLLIVGGDDYAVIRMNQEAFAKMNSAKVKEMKIVPGATHLFEEPGKLEEVSRLATEWFNRHLAGSQTK